MGILVNTSSKHFILEYESSIATFTHTYYFKYTNIFHHLP